MSTRETKKTRKKEFEIKETQEEVKKRGGRKKEEKGDRKEE